MKKNNRVNEIGTNFQGLKMTIVKYNNKNDIDIEFENGFIVKNRHYSDFKNGSIKNLMYPSVLGVGYLGGNKYPISINRRITLEYDKWYRMLSRCYSESELKKFPTYKDCCVCEEWLNFQNFAKWFKENYYEIPNQIMCLDKDILFKHNKVYEPSKCCIVPNDINVLFTKTNSKRGDYPIGVCWNENHNAFSSQMSKENKILHLGYFNTYQEAFYKYKYEKEKEIKRQAEKYKQYLPINVYNAMLNYEVEIDD